MKSLLFFVSAPDNEKILFLMYAESKFLIFTKIKSTGYWHVADAIISNLCYYSPLPDEITVLNVSADYANNLSSKLETNFLFIKINVWQNAKLEMILLDFGNFLHQHFQGSFFNLIWAQVRFFNILKNQNHGRPQSPMELLFGRAWTNGLSDANEEPSVVPLVQYKFGEIADALNFKNLLNGSLKI